MGVSYFAKSHGAVLPIYTNCIKLNPKIEFTRENNFQDLPFWEIFIKNQNGQIIREIYPQTHRHPTIPLV